MCLLQLHMVLLYKKKYFAQLLPTLCKMITDVADSILVLLETLWLQVPCTGT